MTETIQEKLEWVIPLLYKWLDGGELRHRLSPNSEWKPWWRTELPNFCGPKENYRVLPKWAWELVDAERDGKTIQYLDRYLGWVDVRTEEGNFNLPENRYQVKPDPELVPGVEKLLVEAAEKVLKEYDAAHCAIGNDYKLMNSLEALRIALATSKGSQVMVKSEAAIEKLMPKKESPRCQCNNLKMLYLFGGSSFGYWCPHMGDSALTDVVAQHIAWQELNELPDWLCKYRKEKQE